MGSVSDGVKCPICGMNAHMEVWYHTGSLSVSCFACDYHFSKMHRFDCVAEADYDFDEDDFYRKKTGGHGKLCLKIGNNNYSLARTDINPGWIPLDTLIVRFEEQYPETCDMFASDVPYEFAQSYFDGHTLYVTDNMMYLSTLSFGCDIYVDEKGESYLVSRSIIDRPFNEAAHCMVKKRNPLFDALVEDYLHMTVDMCKGFGRYEEMTMRFKDMYPNESLMIEPEPYIEIGWDAEGARRAAEYARAHELSVEERFKSPYYPKLKYVVR